VDRLLKQNGGEIQLFIYDFNGELQDASGNVTVTVRDGAGTTVTSGTATKPASTTGQYEFTLTPTHTANLDVYTVTWSGTVSGQVNTWITQFEIVGGFYFSVGEARAFDNGVLSEVSEYPTQTIINGREIVEQRIETLTGVSWVPRGRRVTINGTGSTELLLPDLRPRTINTVSVLESATVTETFDASKLSDLVSYEHGLLTRKSLGYWLGGNRNVSIYYEHGYDSPPEDLKRAALILLRHTIVPSNIEDRVLSFTDEMGTRQFAVPGSRWPTGIPEVDEILRSYDHRHPALA
jgi:hypothetical protein